MNTPKQILKGFFYTVGSGYGARLASVGLTLLLKRALGPDVFDDIVYAMVIFAMLSTLGQFGQVHALLHYGSTAGSTAGSHTREFIETHFTLNLIICLIVFALSCAVAATLLFLSPESFRWPCLVICVFATLRLLRNLCMTSEALMRQGLEFGRLAFFHGIGTIAALSAALGAAALGWGEWSLIVGGWTTYSTFSLIYVAIFVAGVWYSQPLKLTRLRLNPEWTRRLLRYGGWLWGGWVLQAFVWYYGWLVIERLVGVRELTLYEHAMWFMQIPTAIISHIIFNYTNTLYSRYQNDRDKLADLFGRMLSLIVRVSAPLALIFVLNAKEVVSLTGEQWAGSAQILVWLAAYAFARPLLDEGYSLLWAVGATRRTAAIMGSLALVALPLVPAAALFMGVRGVAYSVGLLAVMGATGMLVSVRRYVAVSWRQVFLPPVVALAAMALAGTAYSGWGASTALLVDFAVRCGLMLLAYSATLALLDRRAIVQLLGEIRRILAPSGTSPQPRTATGEPPAGDESDGSPSA